MKTITDIEIWQLVFGFEGMVGVFNMNNAEVGEREPLLDFVYHITQNLDGKGWLNNAEETHGFVVKDERKVHVIDGRRSFRSLSVGDAIVINYSDGTRDIHKVSFIGFDTLSELDFKIHVRKLSEG